MEQLLSLPRDETCAALLSGSPAAHISVTRSRPQLVWIEILAPRCYVTSFPGRRNATLLVLNHFYRHQSAENGENKHSESATVLANGRMRGLTNYTLLAARQKLKGTGNFGKWLLCRRRCQEMKFLTRRWQVTLACHNLCLLLRAQLLELSPSFLFS